MHEHIIFNLYAHNPQSAVILPTHTKLFYINDRLAVTSTFLIPMRPKIIQIDIVVMQPRYFSTPLTEKLILSDDLAIWFPVTIN